MEDNELLIPGTDIKVGLQNLDSGAGLADFVIIEGGVVTKIIPRSQTTSPHFNVGVDMELISGYSITVTSIDPNNNFILLEVCKLSRDGEVK
jgi:hypothetical protein